MANIKYDGRNGRFSIIEITKEEMRELMEILGENKTSDKMKIFQLDLNDDIDLMNINSGRKEVPF